MNLAVLIPAYRPGSALPRLIEALVRQPWRAVIVVNDGSGSEYDDCFKALMSHRAQVRVLENSVNLGKGAALKSGLSFVLSEFPDCLGVVTADADGQHHSEDITKVAKALKAQPDNLILGSRQFHGKVPLRSWIGNQLTRLAFFLIAGRKISDTQTGLRGIPLRLIPSLLRISTSGYEFELDMLTVCKHQACPIREVRIRAIYEKGNPSSHFNPLVDSLRIYFVLLRFSFVSFTTAVVDNLVFSAVFWLFGNVPSAQVVGRIAAVFFNYPLARKAVFLSPERLSATLLKYLLLVIGSGAASYMLMTFIHNYVAVGVVQAKIAAESALFLVNFVLQRDFVFTRKKAVATATDWDRYYSSTPFTAKLTRKYTGSVIVAALKRYGHLNERSSLVEIGGANSCFLDRIMTECSPGAYHVVDSNEYGLSLLHSRVDGNPKVILHTADCLDLDIDLKADVVFSVGLIEHFQPTDTRRAILAHFDILKKGGIAVISFPTPTLLYRAARFFTEASGLWKFPDERPLKHEEAFESIRQRGILLFEQTLWPLVFTQHIMVAKKL